MTRNKVRDFCRKKTREIDAQSGTNAYLQLAEVSEGLSDDSKGVEILRSLLTDGGTAVCDLRSGLQRFRTSH